MVGDTAQDLDTARVSVSVAQRKLGFAKNVYVYFLIRFQKVLCISKVTLGIKFQNFVASRFFESRKFSTFKNLRFF